MKKKQSIKPKTKPAHEEPASSAHAPADATSEATEMPFAFITYPQGT